MTHETKIFKVGTLTYTKGALAILFFWLLWGDVCFVLMETVVPSILPLKLRSLESPNWLLALVMTTIPSTMGFFFNPIISVKSDRLRSRWGRRIPFMLLTIPFLVGCLVILAFADRIGFWLQSHVGLVGHLSPNDAAIATIGLFVVLFSFFNTFVTSVFWYLFNDVVPEHLLARFMSWFRVVSTLTSAIYSFFIFKHAMTHTVEIFLGAALLYLFGYGLMCINVKEGEYPPPSENIDGHIGLISSIKTYAKECFSLWHYGYQFLITFIGSFSSGMGVFGVFFSMAIGLNLDQMGKIGGFTNIVVSVMIVGAGWLADRFHPFRVCLAASFLGLLVAPVGLIWLFWHPTPEVAFRFQLCWALFIGAPIAALGGVWDPTLFMRFFPRDRYGQFCSANAMCRAAGFIIGGTAAGFFLDIVKKFSGPINPYLFIPVWGLFFGIWPPFLLWKMYCSWKRHGGDEAYVPPMPPGCGSGDSMAGPKWEEEIKVEQPDYQPQK